MSLEPVNTRPSAAVERAKLDEVDKRYRRKRGHKDPADCVRDRVRQLELEKVFRDRYGNCLPDDDSGRDDLGIAVDHLGALGRTWPQIRRWAEVWAPWASSDLVMEVIAEAQSAQRRWTASDLGRRLNLSWDDRTRLGIGTIAPGDLTDQEFQKRRRDRKRQRDRDRARTKRNAERGSRPQSFSPRASAVFAQLTPTWQRSCEIAKSCNLEGLSGRSLQRAINRALNELVIANAIERAGHPHSGYVYRQIT